MAEAWIDSLPLAQTTVDYDAERRSEPDLIDRLLADKRTWVLLINNGLIATPKRTAAVVPGALACEDDPAAPRPDAEVSDADARLALLPAAIARAEASCAGTLVVYLGCDRAREPTAFYLALDMSRVCALPRDAAEDADHEQGRTATTFCQRALRDFDWVELRAFAPCASPRDAGLATSAVAVCAWHARQRFCPTCGSPVVPALAGWAQTCTDERDGSRLLFPRIEPAVITSVIDEAGRILLQHNVAWRDKFFSVSAGFVEAGESLEHAVRREVREEVGIELDEVRYLGSQPWPFPASIMMGFTARARTTEIAVDHTEVACARWFTRDELARSRAAGELMLPARASIARSMIERWYGSRLD